MNRIQNIDRKGKDKKIKELELENSLLRQKLELIGKVCGLDELARVPAFKERMATARPLATVWKSGDNVVFQTNNEEDKKYLESQIEKKIERVSELAGQDVEKGTEEKSDVLKHFSK